MPRYDFLVDTYRTERLKTLSVWSQVPDARMRHSLEARARSPLDHMVHQCASEDAWMTSMLGITVSRPVLPAQETRLAFLEHYAAVSSERLAALSAKPDGWFEEPTQFFDVVRSRAWVLVRRFTHSAHHRGQLSACLRTWGKALYSTYGPTADTGGLPKNGAATVYRYESVDDLLAGETSAAAMPPLPGVGTASPTERGGEPVRPRREETSAVDATVEVSTDPTRLDLDLVCGLLQTSYWAAGRRRTVIERSIKNSLCFGAYQNDRQVAFARVVSDRAVFAYLMDVFVVPEFRGRGLSKRLMRAILDHPDLRNLRMFLLATRDAHGLYARFGFRPLPQPDVWMVIHDPDSDSRAI